MYIRLDDKVLKTNTNQKCNVNTINQKFKYLTKNFFYTQHFYVHSMQLIFTYSVEVHWQKIMR